MLVSPTIAAPHNIHCRYYFRHILEVALQFGRCWIFVFWKIWNKVAHMENLLTDANLLAGIHLWRTRKTNWPNDFHNMFYQELSRSKQNGLNASWWKQMVGHLSGWKALRPLTKEEVYLRGLDHLEQLQIAYKQIIASSPDSSLNLTATKWETLEELYSIAFDIKGVYSPVFGSKLCHFILPNAFPVIDRDVIGVNSRAY